MVVRVMVDDEEAVKVTPPIFAPTSMRRSDGAAKPLSLSLLQVYP